jgi:hypothetical protein
VLGGYNWAALFLGNINMRIWSFRLGDPENLDSKMNMATSPSGLVPENGCTSEAQQM